MFSSSNNQPTKVTEAMERLREIQEDLRAAVDTLEGLKAGNPDGVVILAASGATDIVATAIEKINAVVGICASASDVAKQPFDNTVD
jgi:N-acetylmuramic acid 6-phosphate (MurNAc-6-P) etherase